MAIPDYQTIMLPLLIEKTYELKKIDLDFFLDD